MDSSFVFTWIVIPLLIFLSRVLDVSLGTMRIIYLSKSNKLLAPLLGFFEVLIWLIAIMQVMQNLDNVFYYLAYASGFALGNYVGICIEERLAIGTLVFRIILSHDSANLVEAIKSNGFRLTILNGEGARGPVEVLFTVIKRKDKYKILELIKKHNPHAFYTIDEVRGASEDAFPLKKMSYKKSYYRNLFRRRRKGK